VREREDIALLLSQIAAWLDLSEPEIVDLLEAREHEDDDQAPRAA
jgi:hypothetical protein